MCEVSVGGLFVSVNRAPGSIHNVAWFGARVPQGAVLVTGVGTLDSKLAGVYE